MHLQVVEAKRQVCVAIADEHVLRRRAERHRAEASSWEGRAMLAVKAGDDELARAALVRKGEADELATTYEAQWLDQKRSVDTLRDALRALDQRIHEASRQRTVKRCGRPGASPEAVKHWRMASPTTWPSRRI